MKIKQVIDDAPQHWVGDGFPVRSLFSYSGGNLFDPFLLLDHAGPHHFDPSDNRRGVDVHPHRGFETVTIVFDGEVAHRDSGGHSGTIGPGDVQWMTAASGVVHEEFHSEAFTKSGGNFEIVQLWVNLPAKLKMSPPGYQGITSAQILEVPLDENAGSVRVIAGKFMDTPGPASTHTPINVWDVRLKQDRNAALPIPEGHNSMFLVQSGSVTVDDERVDAGSLVSFELNGQPGSLKIDGNSESRLLMLTGEPIGEPVVGKGPFVMNTAEEITQAIGDFRAGLLGTIDDPTIA